MKINAIVGIVLVSFFMSGCVRYQPSIPDNYTGAIAKIQDSFLAQSKTKIDFYYVSKVNGNKIYNSRFQTLDKNYGRGFSMEPVVLNHDIPAGEPCTITIVARTQYAAPILALMNPVYEIKGDIVFTPMANQEYLVKGRLDDNASFVWIQNIDTKELVGEKIKIEGSSALGHFEK